MAPSLTQGKEPQAACCMRPCPPDGLPIMGAIPGTANAFIAAGHNCWGILGAVRTSVWEACPPSCPPSSQILTDPRPRRSASTLKPTAGHGPGDGRAGGGPEALRPPGRFQPRALHVQRVAPREEDPRGGGRGAVVIRCHPAGAGLVGRSIEGALDVWGMGSGRGCVAAAGGCSCVRAQSCQ